MGRWRSRYARINPRNPGANDALGVCDRSGFVFNHSDLIRQMEWRGNNLVWTGLLVGRPFLYEPNEQERPPIVDSDPKAVMNPRPRTPDIDIDYPVVPPYKQALKELEEDSFYSGDAPPPQVPGKVPGWNEPNPLPPYKEVIKILDKVRFSS